MELLGKVRYRSVRTPEPLQNAASGGVRERGERGIQVGSLKLNHWVQYITRIGFMLGEVSASCIGPATFTPRRSFLGGVSGEVNGLCAHSLPSRETGQIGNEIRVVFTTSPLCPHRRFIPEVIHLAV